MVALTRESNEPPGGECPFAAALWTCSPGASTVFANREARSLFGDRARLRGLGCHVCVRRLRRREQGPPCGWQACLALGETPMPLVAWLVGTGATPHRVLVAPEVLRAPGAESELVHRAYGLEQLVRGSEYLRRVAHRSPESVRPLAGPTTALTEREHEILELLERDLDPFAIARHLHLSVVTVRNHVQHVLGKLGVHSVQEAVAVHILGEETS